MSDRKPKDTKDQKNKWPQIDQADNLDAISSRAGSTSPYPDLIHWPSSTSLPPPNTKSSDQVSLNSNRYPVPIERESSDLSQLRMWDSDLPCSARVSRQYEPSHFTGKNSQKDRMKDLRSSRAVGGYISEHGCLQNPTKRDNGSGSSNPRKIPRDDLRSSRAVGRYARNKGYMQDPSEEDHRNKSRERDQDSDEGTKTNFCGLFCFK